MSKICVKSRVTNNLVFIPISLIESVGVNANGQTVIRRTGKESIRVFETVDEIQRKIDATYNIQQPQQIRQEVVVRQPVVVHQQQRSYRPSTRSNSIIDTAVGVGAGIVLGDVVSDLIDGLFD